MDKNQISRNIEETLKALEHKSFEILFEEENSIRIVVVSNEFIGLRLMKRLEMLSKLFSDLSTHDLFDYHLIFNPLTSNEKELGISETLGEGHSKEDSPSNIAKPNHPTY